MRRLICAAILASLSPSVSAQNAPFTPVGSIAVPGDMLRIDGGRAYLAAGNTLTILDISNPAAPKRAGAYELPDRIWGFSVKGSRAYMACDLHGVEILDVSNPSKVTRAGYYKTKGQAHSVDIFGKTALVADHMLGVVYLDISNEATPVLLGSVFVEGYPRYLAVFGSLYTPSIHQRASTLSILRRQSRSILWARSRPRTQALAASSPSVFPTSPTRRARRSPSSRAAGCCRFTTCRSLAAPVLLSTLATPGRGGRMAMKGRTAHVADNAQGIQVVDLSTPSKPRIASSYKTAKPALDVALVDSLVYVVTGRDELVILRQTP